MSDRRRKFAMLGGLLGLVYLLANGLLPGVPEVLLGAVLGLGCLFFVAALLPDKASKRIRKWKRRGE